jgi:hypothetical protein
MDPGNLLYGAIVATAALAVGAGRGETAADMTETMATTLVVYWLAHIYIATVRKRPPGSATTPLHHLAWHAARNESAILAGGMPVVVVAAGLAVAGVSLWLSVLLSLGVATVVLVLLGLRPGGAPGCAAGGSAAKPSPPRSWAGSSRPCWSRCTSTRRRAESAGRMKRRLRRPGE